MRRMARMPSPQHPAIVSVAQAIRSRRKASGHSQEEFAAVVGLDRAYYSHIERGRYNITLAVLFRIAWGLQCPPSELMPELAELTNLPERSKAQRRPRAV